MTFMYFVFTGKIRPPGMLRTTVVTSSGEVCFKRSFSIRSPDPLGPRRLSTYAGSDELRCIDSIDRLDSIESNHWHTIAQPIDHGRKYGRSVTVHADAIFSY